MPIFPWSRRELPSSLKLDPGELERLMAHIPVLQGLQTEERQRLVGLSGDFLQKKVLDPVQGLVLEPWMHWVIALQACLPVLNLGLRHYDNWRTIIVYGGDFIPAWSATDDVGVVHPAGPHSGESWANGPVVLSWDAVQEEMEGRGNGALNVIIHEVCHQLDGRHGGFDGVPDLPFAMRRSRWIQDFSEAYRLLRHWEKKGKYLPIDPYALENSSEFFAVVCEVFFVQPWVLQEYFPAIYGLLSELFRQDPALRICFIHKL